MTKSMRYAPEVRERAVRMVPKPRVNLTRYHGVPAPNHRCRGEVTPAKRGKELKEAANAEIRTPAECHAAMTWVQRLKRVFNIDIEVCKHCGGAVKVIACIEDQDAIDRILDHLHRKEQDMPVRPLLAPHTRVHLARCLFSRERNPRCHRSTSRDATEYSVGMDSCVHWPGQG